MHTTRKPMRILSLLLSVLLLAGMLSAGVAAEETGPFQGTSVTLGSNLLVNFYAEVTDTEGAVMTFLVNGSEQSVPVTQARHIEGNLYAFSCSLAPAQMTDTVQATLTDSGNTYQTSTSVRVYAQKLFASKQWDMLAANDMMLATLNYGAATQNYFGYNHNDLANDGYVKDYTAQIPSVDSSNMVSGKVSGISFYGASLVFRSRVAVRFFFTGSTENLSFQVDGNTYTPVSKDGMHYVEIPDINPQDYAKNIELTVSDGTDELVVTYSPMHYISRMYGKTENAELKALMSVMYGYYQTAVAYLADPYGNGSDNVASAQ